MRALSIGNMYPPLSLGGYELAWQSSVAQLRAAGHSVRVLTTDHGLGEAEAEERDPEVFRELGWYWRDHEWPRLALRRRLALERANARTIRRHLAEFQPDVVAWWAMGGMSLSLIEQVRRRGIAAAAIVCDDWPLYAPGVDQWTRLFRGRRRLAAPAAAVLVAGSGEVYGPPAQLPVAEDAPLAPQNPYAVSKAACDLLAGQYADGHGLRVVRTRAFNHAGPGQSDDYVVGTLTRQVAQAELAGHAEVVLRTGNVEARRDFTDVRDVVRAYVAAAELAPGAYNVCSGDAVTVRMLIELLSEVAEIEVRHEIDPERLRPNDVPEVRGSAERLRGLTGWAPQIELEDTIRAALAGWRERLRT